MAENRIRGQQLPDAGQSYLTRLGVLYLEQIRLTIVTELYAREMGVREFYESVGGTSYDSVRRHFLKLVEYGWLRKVRTAATGRGRPEALFRSTELAIIDTETWGSIPVSIRDAFTVQLLEEMASRLADALEVGAADVRGDEVAAFREFELDELTWCKANRAIEGCFKLILQKQTDAKIRLETSRERPSTIVVNLAAFETGGPLGGPDLPRSQPSGGPQALSWPERIGRVFADPLDLDIVDELNRSTMTPAELHATLGGASSQTFLRRCRRLSDLGWAVEVGTETGGPLHGASVQRFRAATPDISFSDVVRRIATPLRRGVSWDAFAPFVEASIAALASGAFNNRADRHMTMSPVLVDEIGRSQILDVLRGLEATIAQLQVEAAGRSHAPTDRLFRSAFLASGFSAGTGA